MRLLKFTFKLLLGFNLMLSCAFGLEFSAIDSTMEQNIQKTLALLQKNTHNAPISAANAQEIAKEVFLIFDSIFDYQLMAQLSLSKEYKTLSETQKKEYNQAFEQNLKKSFTDKLRLYKDEEMKVVGGEQSKNNRYNLKTSMVLDGKLNYIVFKL